MSLSDKLKNEIKNKVYMVRGTVILIQLVEIIHVG